MLDSGSLEPSGERLAPMEDEGLATVKTLAGEIVGEGRLFRPRRPIPGRLRGWEATLVASDFGSADWLLPFVGHHVRLELGDGSGRTVFVEGPAQSGLGQAGMTAFHLISVEQT